jgi:ribonuclease BN (tRNA processing enzyme)
MTLTRRRFLAGAATTLATTIGCGQRSVAPAAASAPSAPPSAPPPSAAGSSAVALQAAPSKGTRVILLGTGGGPRVTLHGRAKPGTALVMDGELAVVDCGSGVTQQLVAAGLPLNALRYVFVTHHHSDHNLDYGNLVYSAWAAGLKTPVDTYGPPPIKAMTDAYWTLNRFDIETRIADEGRPDVRTLVTPHEFEDSGVVMKNKSVRVTSKRVFHPPVVQAYAYRFDTADRSVVISGDTGFSQELVALATDADLLVHEVMHLGGVEAMLKRVPNAPTLRTNLLRHHTTTEDVGKVAAAARVKKLVLTHLVPPDDPSITEEMWLAGVRKHYQGPVVLGRDLLEV